MLSHRKDIDALRGLSITLVVIFHAFPEKLRGGFIGVDVFFVISGFLITSIILREVSEQRFSFPNFYSRRIKRLFPALLTVLLASIVIGGCILFQDEYKQLGQHIFSSALFVQNFTLMNELGYFDVDTVYKPLLHLWSLSIEEQYYLIWPLLLVLAFNMRVNITITLFSGIVLSFFLNLFFVANHKDAVFFHAVTRFWELGIGSLLALSIIKRHQLITQLQKINANILFTLGVLLITLGAFFLNQELFYPYWFGLIPTLGACLFILAQKELHFWFGLRQIGLISYPLYLWHWVLISFLTIYLGRTPETLWLLGAIALSIVLAYLTYRYIEQIRHHQSNKTTLALLATVLITAFTGKFILQQDGLPNRPNLAYLNAFNVQFKRTPASDTACDDYIAQHLHQKRTFQYCRANALKQHPEKRLAIIGDSHAHTLFPGLSALAENNEYSTILLANSSCPPLDLSPKLVPLP